MRHMCNGGMYKGVAIISGQFSPDRGSLRGYCWVGCGMTRGKRSLEKIVRIFGCCFGWCFGYYMGGAWCHGWALGAVLGVVLVAVREVLRWEAF